MAAHFSRSRGSRLGMLVSVSAVLAAAGCGPSIQDLREEGIAQYRNHQYIESMATMEALLEEDPNDAPANYYMGLNYRALATRKFREDDVPAARRNLDWAIMYYTQAVKSWPNYLAAIDAKTEALEARGKYDDALALAEQAAETNRGTAAAHFVFLGNEYRDRADYDAALRAYKTALANDASSSEAYIAMGKLYQRTGDRELARDAFQKAYELDGPHSEAADLLAQLNAGSDVRTASHTPQ